MENRSIMKVRAIVFCICTVTLALAAFIAYLLSKYPEPKRDFYLEPLSQIFGLAVVLILNRIQKTNQLLMKQTIGLIILSLWVRFVIMTAIFGLTAANRGEMGLLTMAFSLFVFYHLWTVQTANKQAKRTLELNDDSASESRIVL